jgi:hypothetical protein
MRTKTGRKRYELRKELPELVFGQIKQVRRFSQSLLRGKEKIRGDLRLICTGHNALKLFWACKAGSVGQEFRSQLLDITRETSH